MARSQHRVSVTAGPFSKELLELFESSILDSPYATEQHASDFFALYPQFLLLGTGAELRREVVLYQQGERAIGRIDFLRRDHGSNFWDIVELKSPQHPVVVRDQSSHPRLSASVLGALSQAQDYREWIESDSRMRHRLLQAGMLVFRPKVLVVVGREDCIVDEMTLRKLSERIRTGSIDVRSYTDLWRFAKSCYKSCGMVFPSGMGYTPEEAASDFIITSALLDQGEATMTVQGTQTKSLIIRGHKAVLGPDIEIVGNIEVGVLHVYGKVVGRIEAKRLHLEDGCNVSGELHVDTLTIALGSRVEVGTGSAANCEFVSISAPDRMIQKMGRHRRVAHSQPTIASRE